MQRDQYWGAGHLRINFLEKVGVQLPFCIVMLPPTLCICSCTMYVDSLDVVKH